MVNRRWVIVSDGIGYVAELAGILPSYLRRRGAHIRPCFMSRSDDWPYLEFVRDNWDCAMVWVTSASARAWLERETQESGWHGWAEP